MKNELPYCKNSDGIIGYEESVIAKSETNDCVVRAFASAFTMNYDDAHSYVKTHFKRENRKGVQYYGRLMNRKALIRELINNKYLKAIGRETGVNSLNGAPILTLSYPVKVKGVKKERKMTVGMFTKAHPMGTYILMVREHTFTIKNGVVYGNERDSKQLKKVVIAAWEVIDF